MKDLLAPIKLKNCNLIQALEWIAFGYEPVRSEDENLDGRKLYRGTIISNPLGRRKAIITQEEEYYASGISDASELLKKALIIGSITIYAKHISYQGVIKDLEKIKVNKLDDYDQEKIGISFSDDLFQIYITIPSKNVYNPHIWNCADICFSVKELKKIFPKENLAETAILKKTTIFFNGNIQHPTWIL